MREHPANRIYNIDLHRLGISPGDRVLDLGCAGGGHTIPFARAGFVMVGADSDPSLLERLAGEAEREGLPITTWLHSAQDALPQPGSFDAVICTEVLEHVPDYRAGMAEIARALRPGGRACVSVPTALTELIFHRLHPYYARDSTHLNIFTRELLSTELERAGLRVLHTEGRNFEWTVFWLLHSIAGSHFDHTGRPLENEHLSRRYERTLGWLQRRGAAERLTAIGNHVLPKSLYVYVERAQDASRAA